MIDKFYSVDNGFVEVNCFSIDEIYLRLIVAKLQESRAAIIKDLVSSLQPDEFLVFTDSKAGRIEIRCWKYYNN